MRGDSFLSRHQDTSISLLFSWQKQVQVLGVGPAPLPFKKLTAESLAQAIRETVTNMVMRKRTAELGRHLQTEDGPGRTVELFSNT